MSVVGYQACMAWTNTVILENIFNHLRQLILFAQLVN